MFQSEDSMICVNRYKQTFMNSKTTKTIIIIIVVHFVQPLKVYSYFFFFYYCLHFLIQSKWVAVSLFAKFKQTSFWIINTGMKNFIDNT